MEVALGERVFFDRRSRATCCGGAVPGQDWLSPRNRTLVAVGTTDTIAGSAQALAMLMPNARALDIPGRDHMLAVGDKAFKAGVLAFLEDAG